MTDPAPAPSEDQRRSYRLPAFLIVLGAIGAAQAATWFYFRNRQPITDELTHERLRPRSDA